MPHTKFLSIPLIDRTKPLLSEQFNDALQGADSNIHAQLEAHRNATPIDHPDKSVTTEKLADRCVTPEKLAVRPSDFGAYSRGEVDNLLKGIYTKTETDTLFKNVYTKPETDTMFQGVYKKAETDGLLANIYKKPETDSLLTKYYTRPEVDKLLEALKQQKTNEGGYTKTEADTRFANVYTKVEVNNISSNLSSAIANANQAISNTYAQIINETKTLIAGYYPKADVDEKVERARERGYDAEEKHHIPLVWVLDNNGNPEARVWFNNEIYRIGGLAQISNDELKLLPPNMDENAVEYQGRKIVVSDFHARRDPDKHSKDYPCIWMEHTGNNWQVDLEQICQIKGISFNPVDTHLSGVAWHPNGGSGGGGSYYSYPLPICKQPAILISIDGQKYISLSEAVFGDKDEKIKDDIYPNVYYQLPYAVHARYIALNTAYNFAAGATGPYGTGYDVISVLANVQIYGLPL